MKRSTTYRIGELLGAYVRERRFGEKLLEVEAVRCWSELVNPVFARYCKETQVRDRCLYVVITSPVVKAELQMMREKLRAELNQRLGEEVILRIIFR